LLLASVLTVLTYGLLIRAWAYSLSWWNQRLEFAPALHIWCTTNLARFVPGAVWQFVGLASLAAAHGVSVVAATGAVLLQQLLFLVVGLGLGLVLAPQFLGSWARGLPTIAGVTLAAALVPAILLGFPTVSAWLGRLAERLLGRTAVMPAPPRRALGLYLVTMLAGWIGYGVAFWLFGRAVLGTDAPGLALSVAAFTTSYVAGLIAVFAPGGIVVREAALVAALGPALGPARALLLALGSRLWLLALEVVTAALVIVWFRTRRTPSTPLPRS
jgi:hypothetical protein